MHGGAGVSQDFPLAVCMPYENPQTCRWADEVHRRSIARLELAKLMQEDNEIRK